MMINKAVASLTNEQVLIKQAKADLEAFEAIYDFYFAQVYNYTRYRVNDSHTADDLTSEIFESVLTKLHTYQPDRGPFAAWLFTIARNTVNYHLRKQKIRQWLSLDHFHNYANKEPAPDEVIIKDETQHDLLQAVSQLSQRECELIALKFTSGLTNRTISKMTGLKEGHVAVILHRAVQRIRAQMDSEKGHL
jgi:RNA polymerase sigma-70 factor (ECF subfamily)